MLQRSDFNRQSSSAMEVCASISYDTKRELLPGNMDRQLSLIPHGHLHFSSPAEEMLFLQLHVTQTYETSYHFSDSIELIA